MVYLIAVLLVIAIFVSYVLITKNYTYWKRRKIPYIKPSFPFGNFKSVIFFRNSIGKFIENIYKSSRESVVGIWVFGEPLLVIRSPQVIKQILIKDFAYFHDRTVLANEDADPVCSHMLFLSKNPHWRTIRQKMSPMFTTTKLKEMVVLMNTTGDSMMLYLGQNQGAVIDAKELCMKYTVELLTSIVFGLNAKCFDREDAKFRTVAGNLFLGNPGNFVRFVTYFLVPKVAKVLGIAFFNPSRIDFLRKVLWDVIGYRTSMETKRNDVMDAIMKLMDTQNSNGYVFEGDKLVSVAVQFFAAGFETTSSTIAFSLYELSLHQEIQDQLRSEILAHSPSGAEVTYESINDMKYLDQVISETLRKYPVLPFLDRRCSKDYTIPGTDMVIEKGIPVYISIFGLHYDPEYFPNPEVYNPNRFSPQNIGSIDPDTYIPFGSGPRICVGKRLGLIASKLCLTRILREYKVETCPESAQKIEFNPMAFTIALTHDLNVRLIKL